MSTGDYYYHTYDNTTTLPIKVSTTTTGGLYPTNTFYNNYITPPSYQFDMTSPVDKKLAFIRFKVGFSKREFIETLGHLPDDLYIVNTFHCTLSNTIVFMMASEKFTMCEEGTNIPEVVVEDGVWDYKARKQFSDKVEEVYG